MMLCFRFERSYALLMNAIFIVEENKQEYCPLLKSVRKSG